MRKGNFNSSNNGMFACESVAIENGAVESGTIFQSVLTCDNGAGNVFILICEKMLTCGSSLADRCFVIFNDLFACKSSDRQFGYAKNPETLTGGGFSRLKPPSSLYSELFKTCCYNQQCFLLLRHFEIIILCHCNCGKAIHSLFPCDICNFACQFWQYFIMQFLKFCKVYQTINCLYNIVRVKTHDKPAGCEWVFMSGVLKSEHYDGVDDTAAECETRLDFTPFCRCRGYCIEISFARFCRSFAIATTAPNLANRHTCRTRFRFPRKGDKKK